MKYIYQKNIIDFIKKEELINVYGEKNKIDEEQVNFIFENYKSLLEKNKEELIAEDEKYNGYFNKLTEKNIENHQIFLEIYIKSKYQLIREKIAPFIYSDNINLLVSNGCSIYCGSKGINGETNESLKNLLKDFKMGNAKNLEKTIVAYETATETPEKILDKLYQISNYFENILKDEPKRNKVGKLINQYQELLLKNYVLGIEYSNPFLHEELFLKLLGIKKYNQINLFTLNYDILIETAAEKLGIPLNNGFQGFQIRKFNPANFNYKNYIETVDGNKKITKNMNLIKLHGSLSWKFDEGMLPYNIVERQLKIDNNGKLQYEEIFSTEKEVIIYPVQTKKSYSLDLPYSEMFRQFNEAINKSNSTLFIMGYSFLDEHINDIIKSSLSNPYINIVIFMYSSMEECEKNSYLEDLIRRATLDSRITMFFGNLLGDFKNIVQNIIPIEQEKDPYRELEKIFKNLKPSSEGEN